MLASISGPPRNRRRTEIELPLEPNSCQTDKLPSDTPPSQGPRIDNPQFCSTTHPTGRDCCAGLVGPADDGAEGFVGCAKLQKPTFLTFHPMGHHSIR